MKTQQARFVAIIVMLAFTVLVMGIAATYIGILTKDPVKTWFFPVVVGLVLTWWLINAFVNLKLSLWHKRHMALQQTGVFEYIRRNTALAHVEPLPEGATPEQSIEWFERAIRESAGKTYDTFGVVCGEEVYGVVEGMKLVVTVTKPETAKAFRKLDRAYKEFITVVEVLD